MNRWEVQFAKWIVPATVTAPSAADAIVVASAMIREAAGPGIVADEAFRQPTSVKWLGAATANPGAERDLSATTQALVRGPVEQAFAMFGAGAGPAQVMKQLGLSLATARELLKLWSERDDGPTPAPAPAGPRVPTWKCKLCGEWANAQDLETKHRHEDNPASVYYGYACTVCGSQIPHGKTVGPWHEQTCTSWAAEAKQLEQPAPAVVG